MRTMANAIQDPAVYRPAATSIIYDKLIRCAISKDETAFSRQTLTLGPSPLSLTAFSPSESGLRTASWLGFVSGLCCGMGITAILALATLGN